jgi:hypothetical protein
MAATMEKITAAVVSWTRTARAAGGRRIIPSAMRKYPIYFPILPNSIGETRVYIC